LIHPFAVETDLCSRDVEHECGLRDIGLGIRLHVFRGEGRARLLASGRVTDPRSEVADQEDGRVAELLESAQLCEHDAMAEMEIRR
jgi:hypothetical protein